VDIERLGFKRRETVGDGCQNPAYIVKVIQTLVEPEVPEIIAERLQTQEGRELFIHSHHGILGVGARSFDRAPEGIVDDTAGLAGQDFTRHPPAGVIRRGLIAMALVGWENISMLKRYGIIDKNMLRAGTGKLNAYLEEQKRRPLKVTPIRNAK
jgi:hypothetical protein